MIKLGMYVVWLSNVCKFGHARKLPHCDSTALKVLMVNLLVLAFIGEN